jgi:ribosomal protein S18 acetylase RimI-like enzyme
MNHIQIRKATAEDTQNIVDVNTHTWKYAYASIFNDEVFEERLKAKKDRIKRWSIWIKNSNHFYVAVDKNKDDKIIGYMVCGTNESNKYPSTGAIQALYLLKEYHGQNIGTNLFKTGINDLISLGYNKATVECLKDNSFVKFYLKYGAKIVDEYEVEIHGQKVKEYTLLYSDIYKLIKSQN